MDPGPPKYKAGVLTTWPWHSVCPVPTIKAAVGTGLCPSDIQNNRSSCIVNFEVYIKVTSDYDLGYESVYHKDGDRILLWNVGILLLSYTFLGASLIPGLAGGSACTLKYVRFMSRLSFNSTWYNLELLATLHFNYIFFTTPLSTMLKKIKLTKN
jgi:hypothetical protein